MPELWATPQINTREQEDNAFTNHLLGWPLICFGIPHSLLRHTSWIVYYWYTKIRRQTLKNIQNSTPCCCWQCKRPLLLPGSTFFFSYRSWWVALHQLLLRRYVFWQWARSSGILGTASTYRASIRRAARTGASPVESTGILPQHLIISNWASSHRIASAPWLVRRKDEFLRKWARIVSCQSQSTDLQLKRDEALDHFLDDEKLSRTKELTRTVFTIQRFHDCYTRTIQAWEVFEREEIQAFDLQGFDSLRSRWKRHLLVINGQIANLRSCTIRLHQHLVLFDGMKAGVSVMIHLQRIRVNNIEIVGASSLRESSASTRHSNFLQVLTLMTVVSTCISSGALL